MSSLSDEMRKYTKILSESRITDNPEVSYTLKGKSGAAEKRGEFEKAIVTLSGSKSGVFTKYAKAYKEIDDKAKEIEALKDSLNEKVKNSVDELFDVDDALYTRVVESVSMMATLSKYSPATTSQESEFDINGFVTELFEIATDDLLPMMNALKQKYTKIVEKTKKEVPSRLTIKTQESTNMDNNSYPDLKQWADNFSEKMNSRLVNIDSKMDYLVSRLPKEISQGL